MTHPWPPVSIVIPARNAADTIGETLQAALAQDYQGSVEVVVADGSDDDRMADLIRREFPQVKVTSNPAKNTPAGLNRAIEASTGEVVARCDAHAVLPPNYVRLAVHTLIELDPTCVGGMQIPVGDNLVGRTVALAMRSRLGSGNSRYKVGGGSGLTDTVYLGVYRRRTLDELGGFDESLLRNQDYELNWRLRRRGGSVWLNSNLKVQYKPRRNLGSLFRQYWDYGWWKAIMLRRNPRSVKPRQLFAPVLVLGFPVLVQLYFPVIVLYGQWAKLRQRGDDIAPLLLPVVLWIMHIAWGLGFWASVFNMARLLFRRRRHTWTSP